MKVMADGKIYDSINCHVAVLLDPEDKKNISNMVLDTTEVYSSFPSNMRISEVEGWNERLKKHFKRKSVNLPERS